MAAPFFLRPRLRGEVLVAVSPVADSGAQPAPDSPSAAEAASVVSAQPAAVEPPAV